MALVLYAFLQERGLNAHMANLANAGNAKAPTVVESTPSVNVLETLIPKEGRPRPIASAPSIPRILYNTKPTIAERAKNPTNHPAITPIIRISVIAPRMSTLIPVSCIEKDCRYAHPCRHIDAVSSNVSVCVCNPAAYPKQEASRRSFAQSRFAGVNVNGSSQP